MKTTAFYIWLLFTSASLYSQETLYDLLKQYNRNDIDYMSVQELSNLKSETLILDARELNEYEVSHIENAIFVGFNDFKPDSTLVNIVDKAQKIVVYCSIGIRSESIARKLKKVGYTHVFNLYGGIFEWKNNDYPLINSEGKETNKVHVFSEAWSKWLKKGDKMY